VTNRLGSKEFAKLASLLFGFAAFFTVFFAPVLFSGSYMTGGDGLLQALPTYLGSTPLWEPNMMLGYPLFADPNQAYWYPLLRVTRALPFLLSFNIYAVAPYVIAGFGMAAFSRRVSGSTIGGVVAGLTFSMGGFMISHQGHINLIHPAAWTPYILWSIEEVRRRPGFKPIAGGAVAFALSASSGSEQPLVYIGLVGMAYALVFRGTQPETRRKFLPAVALIFVLGFGLSAISLIPTIELVGQSSRVHQSYANFIAFSTHRAEFVIRMLFPYFFGTTASALYPWSHDNLGAFPEASNYAGILPLMLAVIGLTNRMRRPQVLFWLGVGVWGAWMAVGDGFFGARLAYILPVYGMFRIPGRHALEFTFAIAVLASYGVSAIEHRRVASSSLVLAIAVPGSLLLASCAVIAMRGGALRVAVNDATAAAPVPLVPWQNAALGIPCALLVLGGVVLLVWSRIRNRPVAHILGVIAVACDLSTFARCAYWRFSTVPAAISRPPAVADDMRDRLKAEHGRMLASLGARLPQSIPPNLSTLWHVPAVGGYVSLELHTVNDALQIDPAGEIPESALALYGNKALDVVGTRYILLPPSPAGLRPVSEEFSGDVLGGFIGANAITPDKTLVYGFPTPQTATAIDLVSALGLSTKVPNKAIVAELTITDTGHHVFAIPIIAGKDTSESAYDRPDVHPFVRHAKAHRFSGDSMAQLYVARFQVPTKLPIRRLMIHWRFASPTIGALSVVHLALIDKHRNVAYAVTPQSRFYAEPEHWQRQAWPGNDVLMKNLQAYPEAWTVGTVRYLPDDQAISAVQHAQRPGAESFDPRREALISSMSMASFSSTVIARTDDVRVLEASATTERYDVTCRTRCLLVINGAWYPGWLAAEDGHSTDSLRVDTVLRGVTMTAGHHIIETWFAPLSLKLGIAVTSITTLLMLVIAFTYPRRALPGTP
jgi:hypothetical protein